MALPPPHSQSTAAQNEPDEQYIAIFGSIRSLFEDIRPSQPAASTGEEQTRKTHGALYRDSKKL